MDFKKNAELHQELNSTFFLLPQTFRIVQIKLTVREVCQDKNSILAESKLCKCVPR